MPHKCRQNMIKIPIGYDAREAVAYSVLAHSIQAHASQPVSITPLKLSQLKDVLTRERHPLQSTDFSFSRFLTPYLCGYTGWAVHTVTGTAMAGETAKRREGQEGRCGLMLY